MITSWNQVIRYCVSAALSYSELLTWCCGTWAKIKVWIICLPDIFSCSELCSEENQQLGKFRLDLGWNEAVGRISAHSIGVTVSPSAHLHNARPEQACWMLSVSQPKSVGGVVGRSSKCSLLIPPSEVRTLLELTASSWDPELTVGWSHFFVMPDILYFVLLILLSLGQAPAQQPPLSPTHFLHLLCLLI